MQHDPIFNPAPKVPPPTTLKGAAIRMLPAVMLAICIKGSDDSGHIIRADALVSLGRQLRRIGEAVDPLTRGKVVSRANDWAQRAFRAGAAHVSEPHEMLAATALMLLKMQSEPDLAFKDAEAPTLVAAAISLDVDEFERDWGSKPQLAKAAGAMLDQLRLDGAVREPNLRLIEAGDGSLTLPG